MSEMIRNRFSKVRRFTRMGEVNDKVLTQQQFKDECDMNRIVKNAQRGIPPRFTAQGAPHYGDFANIPDLAQSYEKVARAQEAFLTLPAALRAELGNDATRINELTSDQVARYKLGKTLPAPTLASNVSDPLAAGGALKTTKADEVAQALKAGDS